MEKTQHPSCHFSLLCQWQEPQRITELFPCEHTQALGLCSTADTWSQIRRPMCHSWSRRVTKVSWKGRTRAELGKVDLDRWRGKDRMQGLQAEQWSRGTGKSPPGSRGAGLSRGRTLEGEDAAQKEGSTGWDVVGDKETGRKKVELDKEIFGFQEFGLFSRARGAPEALSRKMTGKIKTCFQKANLIACQRVGWLRTIYGDQKEGYSSHGLGVPLGKSLVY